MYHLERHNDGDVLAGRIELAQLGVSSLHNLVGRMALTESVVVCRQIQWELHRDGVCDAPPIPKQVVCSGHLIVVVAFGIESRYRRSLHTKACCVLNQHSLCVCSRVMLL